MVRTSNLVDARELVLLVLLLAGYGLWMGDLVAQDFTTINIVGPAALILILCAGAWWQARRDPRSIWQSLFWFRIACAAYYGVGALAHVLANDTTSLSITSFYLFSDETAFKVGLINVLSILTVLTTASVVSSRLKWMQAERVACRSSQRWTILFAASFLVVGGAIRYFVVLPWTLGLADIVPGLVLPLGRSYIIGLFLIVLAGLRGSPQALALAAVLVPIDLAIALLTFAKTEVLLTLIFVYLAVLHHKLSLGRVLIGLVLILGIYSQLDPIIQHGRSELWRQNRSTQGSLQQRQDILAQYTGTERQGTVSAEQQSWFSRLSYVSVAAMVVDWHDSGRAGNSLDYLFVVLVPRFIWRDKPVITAVGQELYLAATGHEGSSISPGLFAEAYWNLGWLGIPLLMVLLGMILAIFSRYSQTIIMQERWVHLPAVMLGVLVGVRVDGWFVADIVGGCATALAYALLALALERLMTRRYSRAAAT